MYTPSDEEMAKIEAEAKRSAEKAECEKRIWNLFDLAIERNKAMGFADQDIQFDHVPTVEDFMKVLASMMNNCQSPKQFYMNPILATYSFPYSYMAGVDGGKWELSFVGKNYYLGLSPSLPPNVFYVCPSYFQTGVWAFPLFNEYITLGENICLEKYVDLPDEVNQYTGFRLINATAPYRVTVPASLLK